MGMTVENAVAEIIDWGKSEYLFDLVEKNQELISMIATATLIAYESLDKLKKYPEAVGCISSILEILPSSSILDNTMFDFRKINKLLTAIAIERLEHEKNVIGAAKLA